MGHQIANTIIHRWPSHKDVRTTNSSISHTEYDLRRAYSLYDASEIPRHVEQNLHNAEQSIHLAGNTEGWRQGNATISAKDPSEEQHRLANDRRANQKLRR